MAKKRTLLQKPAKILEGGGGREKEREREDCRETGTRAWNGGAMGEDPTLERSFRGHKDAVNSVAFNPNMKQLISGSQDGCLMIWNFKPQLRAFRFSDHQVLPLPRLRAPQSLRAERAPLQTGAAAPARRGRVCAGREKEARRAHERAPDRAWTQQCPRSHTLLRPAFFSCSPQGPVLSVAITPTGGIIATGSKDRTVRLWAPNISKGRSSVIKAHTGGVRCVSFSPDSTTLLTASDDKTIKMWSIAGQKFKLTLSGHSNWHLFSKVLFSLFYFSLF
jgi:centriolar protein POC1